ncbi:MAG: hypothetical protein ACR2K5_03280 [Pseudolabrys sp.]
MAENNDNKDDAAKASEPNSTNELPNMESPSISPADEVPEIERAPLPDAKAPTGTLTIFSPGDAKAKTLPPRLKITPRMKRSALLAASVAIAAALGAIAGVAGSGIGKSAPVVDTAAAEETQEMRKSIARLTKDIAALKTGIETANKTAGAQIGKIAERIERIDRTETTGSIAKAAATPAPAAVAVATPLPQAKPQPQVLEGWSVRAARNGAILVENRGEIFEVEAGDPLPGLGRIASISHDSGRWVVTTPKGIIVSNNAPPARRRTYYSPYFRPY